jgi:hypothetical protein
MPPLVNRQPVSRNSERPFVANLARIRDDCRDLDPRLMRGVRVAVAALAGFSFAVAFVAGSRTRHPPQRGLPPTPVVERASDVGPAPAPRFEPIRTLPDLLPVQAVVPTVIAARPRATARPVTATTPAPTSSSAVPAPPAAQPVRRPIVPQPRTPVAAPHSTPAPAPQTVDSSGDTFDSSG